MAPRSAIIAASVMIALLASAGAAIAEGNGQGKAHAASPPEQAKAGGLTKHDEPIVAPPPSDPVVTTPPEPTTPAEQAPTPAPPAEQSPPPVTVIAAPAASDPASATIANAPVAQPSAPQTEEPATAARVPVIVTAPAGEDVLELRSGSAAGAATFGAATARAPSWSGDSRSAPTSGSDGSAPWWAALAWALPVVGIGGVATVLVLRHKASRVHARVPASEPSTSPRLRMAPVSPDDLKGLLQNGHAAASRGALDEAVAWFERALDLSPKLAVAHFCRGVCLAANGQVADAYGALRSACTVEPADASYRVHFARVAVALGKHKEAMDALEIVAHAMPELGAAMLEDPLLAGLRDHPRFLMICGAL